MGQFGIIQLLLPKVYRDIALAGLHDEAGHQGRDRTMSLVKFRFYWPGMDGDIEKYVRNFPKYIRRKAQGKTAAKLVVVDHVSYGPCLYGFSVAWNVCWWL